MENNHAFQLVQGTFTPEEAGRVLFTLIQDKINYHNTEILSHQIRFGFDRDVSHSEQRIANLQNIKDSLAEFLKQVGSEGKKLEINGTFEFNIVD